MANTKELQIQNLLDGAGKAGPELTHGLSELVVAKWPMVLWHYGSPDRKVV